MPEECTIMLPLSVITVIMLLWSLALQTILSFHKFAQLLSKFIIKLLLPIFLEKEADK